MLVEMWLVKSMCRTNAITTAKATDKMPNQKKIPFEYVTISCNIKYVLIRLMVLTFTDCKTMEWLLFKYKPISFVVYVLLTLHFLLPGFLSFVLFSMLNNFQKLCIKKQPFRMTQSNSSHTISFFFSLPLLLLPPLSRIQFKRFCFDFTYF